MFADILLPQRGGTYTYTVEDDLSSQVSVGSAVAVQFGKRKIQMGIVWRLHDRRPSFNTKPIVKVLSTQPVVSQTQIEFWQWIADYYMCTLGDVMRFALPSSLKPAGMTSEEFAKDEYKPRMIKYVSLHPDIKDEESLMEICEMLQRRSKAQYAALLKFCDKVGVENVFTADVRRDKLDISAPILKKLTERSILLITERESAIESGRQIDDLDGVKLPCLTAAQSRAKSQIQGSFADHSCVLLHGVTGSGKTEIYMHLIDEQLRAGRTVLYMMPEIAMTSQLVMRIMKVFGEKVTVYHSMLSDSKRAEAYHRMAAATSGQLILGVRSSIFLPMPNLGLIIVDEEHDASYKQSDNAPRYYARDCAVYLARTLNAKCLLASATPSIESYVNGKGGKYGLVTLTERYGEGRLPQTIVSDTLRAVKRGERKSHFNKIMLDRMEDTLKEGRQVMLFQNRRGFAPYIECTNCGWTYHCPRCSVTLTYHKHEHRLRCHTCGFSTSPVTVCPVCKSTELKMQGFGTEKVEEELMRLFPGVRISRLDRDTATSARKYEKIIEEFEKGESDIMVGTQMITKGFDFPQLSLVGILNADNLLNYPDFRASERAYQIMTQVAGRAGRSDDRGEVIIQTAQPNNPIIRQVESLDYEGMVAMQLVERKAFGYPPYGRLVVVTLKYYNKQLVEEAANGLAVNMRAIFGERVYGPHAPVIEKISNENYMTILLKVELGRSFSKVKELLGGMIAGLGDKRIYRNITVYCNVDPQ